MCIILRGSEVKQWAHGVDGLSRSLSNVICERCPVQFRMCPFFFGLANFEVGPNNR